LIVFEIELSTYFCTAACITTCRTAPRMRIDEIIGSAAFGPAPVIAVIGAIGVSETSYSLGCHPDQHVARVAEDEHGSSPDETLSAK